MKIKLKLVSLLIIALLVTSVSIGLFALFHISKSGDSAIAGIQELGNRNIQQIQKDGKKRIEVLRAEFLSQKKEYLKSRVQTIYSILEAVENESSLSLDEQKDKASKLIQALKYGPENKDYFWINDMHPKMVMHPYKPQLNGKDLSDFEDPNGKKLFVEMAEVCQEKGAGFVNYFWPKYGADKPQPKVSYIKLFKNWNWIIGTGLYIDDIDTMVEGRSKEIESKVQAATILMENQMKLKKQEIQKNIRQVMGFIAAVTFIVLGIVLLGAIFFARTNIIAPLAKGVEFAEKLSEGDFTQTIDVTQNDEIGMLAAALNNMITNLSRMFKEVTNGMETLYASTHQLSGVSQQMSAGAEHTSGRSNNVACAAEEMSSNMTAVAAAVEQASANTRTIAISAEQMAATISEIAHNSEKARIITGGATEQAQSSANHMEQLGKAAQEISKVTETITEISEQTNLLALNATIEAARAGEAGKGFAVVANEIKVLARQTAEATGKIKKRIKGIQDSIAIAVSDIDQIPDVINDVNEIVSTIAAAVEEQSVTTQEIANNVAEASQGIREITETVAQSTAVSGEIAKEIGEVNVAANDIATSSSQVNLSALELSTLADQLKVMVGRFKV